MKSKSSKKRNRRIARKYALRHTTAKRDGMCAARRNYGEGRGR